MRGCPQPLRTACRLQFRKRDRFCRRCLQNLRGWPREEERPHLRKVTPPKAPPKTWLQIFCELLDEGLSVFRPLLSPLFGFHDTASDLPISGSNQRVHASSGNASAACRLLELGRHPVATKLHRSVRRKRNLQDLICESSFFFEVGQNEIKEALLTPQVQAPGA